MAREAFIERKFSVGSVAIIDQANTIIAAYQEQGFTLTLRQLYYQFVSRDLIANRQSEYKRLGSVINDARLAGRLDWDAIEDRTRNVRRHSFWSSPANIIESAASGYAEDLWQGQDCRIEVWIEKDALIGVVEPVCARYRIPYFACRGYSSQSEQYAAGKRFKRQIQRGVTPVVLHLGDHDPSGMDMTRDNADRLAMFAREGVEVRRLALNWDQIQQYGPPPNPAKETDSRSGPYIERFGDKSWELDALEPTVIDQLIEDAVEEHLDRDAWDEALAEEDRNKATLDAVSHRWDEIEQLLGGAQ
jgi:hypothetical protein